MSNTDQAPEPTMDEILASIRRIISDEPTDKNAQPSDDNVAGDIARALSFGDDNTVSGMDDDILELTEVVTPGKNLEEELTETLSQKNQPSAFDEQPAFAQQDMPNVANEDLSPADILDDFPAPTLTEPGQTQYTEGDQELSIPEDIFSDTAMRSAGMTDTPEDLAIPEEIAALQDNPIEEVLGEINKPDVSEPEDLLSEIPEIGLEQLETEIPADEQSSNLENDLEDALSWGVEEEEAPHPLEENNAGDELDVLGAEVAGNLLDVEEEQQEISIDDTLMNDQSVTFGELSPEESIESALENAIGSDDEDLEQGWLQDDEETAPADILAQDAPSSFEEEIPELSPEIENVEQELLTQDDTTEEISVEDSAESIDDSEPVVEMMEQIEVPELNDELEENSEVEISEPEVEETEQLEQTAPEPEQDDTEPSHGTEESVDDMELAKAAGITEQEEELGNAVASVKETVEKEIQSELTQQVADNAAPQVSEVIPVQNNPAAAVASPLEESIKDMLKPMLKEWLDDNMPRLLEDAMKQQVLEDKKK